MLENKKFIEFIKSIENFIERKMKINEIKRLKNEFLKWVSSKTLYENIFIIEDLEIYMNINNSLKKVIIISKWIYKKFNKKYNNINESHSLKCLEIRNNLLKEKKYNEEYNYLMNICDCQKIIFKSK